MRISKLSVFLFILLAAILTMSACVSSEDFNDDADSWQESAEGGETGPASTDSAATQIKYVQKDVYLLESERVTANDELSGHTNEYSYDAYGRIAAVAHYTKDGEYNGTSTYSYGDSGVLLFVVDLDTEGTQKSMTTYEYDLLGNCTSSVYHSQYGTMTTTEYTYDINGYLLTKSSKYYTYQYSYNEDYTQCTTKSYSEGKLSSSTVENFDADGNLLSCYYYDSAGSCTGDRIYVYDASGKLANETYSTYEYGTSTTINYIYDEHGNLVFVDNPYYYGDCKEMTYILVTILVPAQ